MDNERAGAVYCKRCFAVSHNDVCGFCGNKKVKKAEENDAVFLTHISGHYTGMLEEALTNGKIPFLKQSTGVSRHPQGLGGYGNFRFFVPFGASERAAEILSEMFSGEAVDDCTEDCANEAVDDCTDDCANEAVDERADGCANEAVD